MITVGFCNEDDDDMEFGQGGQTDRALLKGDDQIVEEKPPSSKTSKNSKTSKETSPFHSSQASLESDFSENAYEESKNVVNNEMEGKVPMRVPQSRTEATSPRPNALIMRADTSAQEMSQSNGHMSPRQNKGDDDHHHKMFQIGKIKHN